MAHLQLGFHESSPPFPPCRLGTPGDHLPLEQRHPVKTTALLQGMCGSKCSCEGRTSKTPCLKKGALKYLTFPNMIEGVFLKEEDLERPGFARPHGLGRKTLNP